VYGIINDCFVANFLNTAPMIFFKSVNIWRRYGQEYDVFLFDSQWR